MVNSFGEALQGRLTTTIIAADIIFCGTQPGRRKPGISLQPGIIGMRDQRPMACAAMTLHPKSFFEAPLAEKQKRDRPSAIASMMGAMLRPLGNIWSMILPPKHSKIENACMPPPPTPLSLDEPPPKFASLIEGKHIDHKNIPRQVFCTLRGSNR